MSDSMTDDVVALGRLNSAYADVITRRAFEELGELMLPTCVVHLDLVSAPARDLTGPEAVAEMLGPAMARFDHFLFAIRHSVVQRGDIFSLPGGPEPLGGALSKQQPVFIPQPE